MYVNNLIFTLLFIDDVETSSNADDGNLILSIIVVINDIFCLSLQLLYFNVIFTNTTTFVLDSVF